MSAQTWAAVANVSLLFRELPFLDRFAAAADAGFARVEAWWPYATATPPAEEVDEFVDAIAVAGVQLTGLNLFAGDMPGGERGILSRPDRRAEFAANLEVMAGIAERTGCRAFNALYGQRVEGLEGQDDTAIENLALAAGRFAPFGGVLLIESLAHGLNGEYPLLTAAQALDVVRRGRAAAGSDNIAVLYDTFHLASNGEDLTAAAAELGPYIGHVQLADAPGRGEPGSGAIDFAAVFDALATAGYRGHVALEYASTTPQTALAWLTEYPQLVLGAHS